MNKLQTSAVIIALVGAIVLVTCSEAKLLRHSRYYEPEPIGPPPPMAFDGPYPAPTGERAIMTVRGVRHPYDGSAPAKIAIEDNPYRGPYPRGVYDRLDGGYGGPRGGRMSMYPRPDYPYGGSGYGGYDRYNGGARRRRDFLDPDFGFKAKFNLASSRRSKCRVDTEADSEIPALGLDSGRVNVDCEVNPVRIAKAAAGAARTYGNYRRDRRRRKQMEQHNLPQKSGSNVKRKRTRINIDSEYERQSDGQPEGRDSARGGGDDDDESDDD